MKKIVSAFIASLALGAHAQAECSFDLGKVFSIIEAMPAQTRVRLYTQDVRILEEATEKFKRNLVGNASFVSFTDTTLGKIGSFGVSQTGCESYVFGGKTWKIVSVAGNSLTGELKRGDASIRQTFELKDAGQLMLRTTLPSLNQPSAVEYHPVEMRSVMRWGDTLPATEEISRALFELMQAYFPKKGVPASVHVKPSEFTLIQQQQAERGYLNHDLYAPLEEPESTGSNQNTTPVAEPNFLDGTWGSDGGVDHWSSLQIEKKETGRVVRLEHKAGPGCRVYVSSNHVHLRVLNGVGGYELSFVPRQMSLRGTSESNQACQAFVQHEMARLKSAGNDHLKKEIMFSLDNTSIVSDGVSLRKRR